MRQLGFLALAVLFAACGGAGGVKPPQPPIQHVHRDPVASVPGSFWEEVPLDPVSLPLASFERDKLVRPPLAARWGELPEAARTRVLEHGVLAFARTDHETSIGEAYLALARKRVPFVITMDSIFAITFRAIDGALYELDRDVIAKILPTALTSAVDRLAAESRAARSDTAEPYALARSILLIARALLDPKADIPPAELQTGVNAELTLVQAHAGFAKSPLLGRLLDYGAFDTQAGLAFGDARIGQFRAVMWLARAGLALGAERTLNVGRARVHARAAMLLARATNESWSLLFGALRFVTGAGDDPGPPELVAKATALGLDLREEATIGNVVRVDHLRTALTRDAVPTVEDTGGRLPTFRLLSPSAPPDARALALLTLTEPHELPSALGVGVALGSPEARALLELERIEPRVLDGAAGLLPRDPALRHASIHASALDALATYLAPSALDSQRTWRDTSAHRRRKLDVALAAWATLRHAVIPFAHGSARALLDEPLVAYDDVQAAIEPHAEALGRLLSLVRQTRLGLAARGVLHDGAAMQLLERVERFVDDALRIVVAQATTPLSPALAHELASMPARIAALERRLGPASAPGVVVTAADPVSGRLLEHATGYVADVWLAIDVAGTASLFVGVHVPFFETTATLRATDVSWAKALTTSPPPRPAWTEP